MATLKERWMEFVRKQSEKTARDPNSKAKIMAGVVILLLIWTQIPKAQGSIIGCGSCVAWAAQFCTGLIAAGGACATVAAFPPLLRACLLASGGAVCAGAAITCAVVCCVPTP